MGLFWDILTGKDHENTVGTGGIPATRYSGEDVQPQDGNCPASVCTPDRHNTLTGAQPRIVAHAEPRAVPVPPHYTGRALPDGAPTAVEADSVFAPREPAKKHWWE